MRLADPVLREYLEYNTDDLRKKDYFYYENIENIIKGELSCLDNYGLDILLSFQGLLAGLKVDKAAVLAEREARRRRQATQDKKDKKRERANYIKYLSHNWKLFRHLFGRITGYLGLENIPNERAFDQMRAENLRAVAELYEEIQEKTLAMGGSTYKDEDLMVGCDEVIGKNTTDNYK